MSTDHSDQPRQPASAGTTSPARPGWPEIVVGLLAMAAATAVAPFFGPLGLELDAVVYGLTLAAWSGIVCLIGFAATALIRIRSWGAFGVRRTTWRWMGIGAAAGVVAFVLKGVVNYAVITLISFDADPQGPYHDAAGGGVLPLILTFAFLAVLTPSARSSSSAVSSPTPCCATGPSSASCPARWSSPSSTASTSP